MAKQRSLVAKQDQWNVESLYPNICAWSEEIKKAVPHSQSPKWPELKAFQGKLHEGPKILKETLETIFKISRQLVKLYTYAHLRHDEDITHDEHKVNYTKILALLHDLNQENAWFEPELLSIDDAILSEMLQSPLLTDYRFHIEKIVRVKKHLLSHESEELLAMASKALQTPHKTFSAINDADFKFGMITNSKGEEKELTHGSYGIYIRDADRELRKNAFTQMHTKYHSFENTMCELLNGEVQSHLFNARARHYSSCLEAALFPQNIDTSVYHALIQAMNENLTPLHQYMALREKIMNIGPLHIYDMQVPLIASIDIQMPYHEAEDCIIESVATLGVDYQNILRRGLKEDRWVDRFENQNKRSGGYSSGCYDSMPYILMNYKDILKDVFTLAHEAGHSMHSYYSHQAQPYHYSSYPIFLAEVASTFNEEILMRLLLERAKTKEERAFLINQKIEDIRGTLFRQTMFAEFELAIHEMAEKEIPLTPKSLNQTYRNLLHRYFGANVIIDAEAESEWARIPHFYYNFYVFQYATGISAALTLADLVVGGKQTEKDAYLSFLKAGSSRHPIDILKTAGVDMRSPQPVAAALKKFEGLVTQLGKELGVSHTT